MADPKQGLLLAFDTASPTVSLAVGDTAGVRAQATLPLRRSSEQLLRTMENVLGQGEATLETLDGVVVLQGPGSFTGLRIGLATVMGLHQATGLPVATVPTLPVLAATAPEDAEDIVAAVDALRGEWYAQRFRILDGTRCAIDAPALVAGEDLGRPGPCRVIGFGLDGLTLPEAAVARTPPPLASVALTVARQRDDVWDARRLTQPIYFRPPAVTLPASRAGS